MEFDLRSELLGVVTKNYVPLTFKKRFHRKRYDLVCYLPPRYSTK